MTPKSFNLLVGIIFLAIAVLHLLRLTFGWEAVIGIWQVPIWASWLAFAVGGVLSYSSFTINRGVSSSGHYTCTGGCGGVSEKPGVCNATVCTRKGMPLEECYCMDGKHRK